MTDVIDLPEPVTRPPDGDAATTTETVAEWLDLWLLVNGPVI